MNGANENIIKKIEKRNIIIIIIEYFPSRQAKQLERAWLYFLSRSFHYSYDLGRIKKTNYFWFWSHRSQSTLRYTYTQLDISLGPITQSCHCLFPIRMEASS